MILKKLATLSVCSAATAIALSLDSAPAQAVTVRQDTCANTYCDPPDTLCHYSRGCVCAFTAQGVCDGSDGCAEG
jgi:hypothetical protein